MVLPLLNVCTNEELKEKEETAEELAWRKRVVKSKILAVGRVSRIFTRLRYVFLPALHLTPTDD